MKECYDSDFEGGERDKNQAPVLGRGGSMDCSLTSNDYQNDGTERNVFENHEFENHGNTIFMAKPSLAYLDGEGGRGIITNSEDGIEPDDSDARKFIGELMLKHN